MIDIGANLTNRAFTGDLSEVLDRAWRSGIERIVVTGTDIESSGRAIALCERDAARLVCTVGVHPHDAAAVGDNWIETLERLSRNAPVRAIGRASCRERVSSVV